MVDDSDLVDASIQSPDTGWRHVVATFEDTAASVTLYIDGVRVGTSGYQGSFPTSLDSATAGSGYTGLLQDVGIYSPALSDSDLTPEQDAFLSQCLCYPNAISTTDRSACTKGTSRYIRT